MDCCDEDPIVEHCRKGFNPVTVSPKLKRPRAPFSPREWCPWTRVFSDKPVFLYPPYSYEPGNPRWSGRLLSYIRHLLSRPGFYHSLPLRKLWPYTWKIVARLSGNPPLPTSHEISEPETVRLRTTVLIVGNSASPSLESSLAHHGVEDMFLADYGSTFYRQDDSGVKYCGKKDKPLYLGGFEDGFLLLDRMRNKLYVVRADMVIYAVGMRDAYPVFLNNDLPGIISSEMAFRLAGCQGCMKGKTIVIVGDSFFSYRLSNLLSRENTVHHIVTGNGAKERTGAILVEEAREISAEGYSRLTHVNVRLKGGGRIRLKADFLVSAVGFHPEIEPPAQMGAGTAYSDVYKDIVIHNRPGGWTGVGNIYVSGEVSGTPPSHILEEAVLVGEKIAAEVRGSRPPNRVLDRLKEIWRAKRLHSMNTVIKQKPWFWLTNRTRGMQFLCPCEDILLEDVLKVYERGYGSLEKIKRYSALGTGSCQGKLCQINALLLLSYIYAEPLGKIGLIRVRAPLSPIEFSMIPGGVEDEV